MSSVNSDLKLPHNYKVKRDHSPGKSDGVVPATDDVDKLTIYHTTPLYEAVVFENEREVKKLIIAGADINFQAPRDYKHPGRTPLHVAASKGNLRIAKLLLEAGANLNLAEADGDTTLSSSVREPASVKVATLLLEASADPNQQDNKGLSALYRVSGNTHPTFTRDHSHLELYELILTKYVEDPVLLPRPCYRVQRTDIRLSIIAEKALARDR